MKPYSLDLRQRVADAVDNSEGSLRQLAQRFCVSLSFILRLLRHRRQTNSLDPAPHGGGHPPALDEAARQRLRDFLNKQPDATLAELRQSLGLSCSLTALWRTLRQMKITRKKKVLHADERQTPRVQQLRQEFQAKLAKVDPSRLVFVDETGANTAMTRTHGRAPQGERVYGSVPGHWESQTLISGMRLSGVVAPFTFAGGTDTVAMRTYVERVLIPELQPGDVVIWDNLKPHKDAQVVQAVESMGARVEPLPPWSPDLTPIEKMYSKVKGFLRTVGARTRATVIKAIGAGLETVCPQDIKGWFQSCGLLVGASVHSRDSPKRLMYEISLVA
jgi:transposase